MKRTAWRAGAIGGAATFGALAQSPSTTSASSATDTANDKIPRSGCLQDNSHGPSTTASTSTATTTSGQSAYVLITSPTPAGDTTARTAGSTTRGTTATGTSGTMPTSSPRSGSPYLLEGR